MTKEELFKKNFPEYVTEKGACLSPFWDLFSAGIECATYELNKGCIQTLTKENAELKARLLCTDEKDFKTELTSILNRYGWDNACETPDHILADYVERCMTNLCSTMGKNIAWHRRKKAAGKTDG